MTQKRFPLGSRRSFTSATTFSPSDTTPKCFADSLGGGRGGRTQCIGPGGAAQGFRFPGAFFLGGGGGREEGGGGGGGRGGGGAIS